MGNENSKTKDPTQNGKVFEKHGNQTVNGVNVHITSKGVQIDANGETTVPQNGQPMSSSPIESNETDYVIIQSDFNHPHTEKKPDSSIQEKNADKSEKEKIQDQKDASLADSNPQLETANSKKESESVTADPKPEGEKAPESEDGTSRPVESREESNPEENPVMNFFKTLVTPTKTSKKETATPDAPKEQSQKENQPAPTTTVAQISDPPAAPKGMSIPPPPPPEPPKMEMKADPAAKPVKPTPKEEPKAAAAAAAKEPDTSKAKSAKDAFSKLFRQKETPVEVPQAEVEVESENKVEPPETADEVAQPVVEEQMVVEVSQPGVEAEKGDPSKTGTLEAAAKPEPPPPAQEAKKVASKPSFLSFFKPKAEPKKATPAPAGAAAAAAVGEAAQTAKGKEEPKAAAKLADVDKPAAAASQGGDDVTNVPRKLEKRNSIHLFFKNLSQKRHSTDAGVQTEPATAAPAAEKAK